MGETQEGIDLKAQVSLSRNEFGHLWSGGVLALKVGGKGVEVALDLSYRDAPEVRGTRVLIKRVDID